MSPKRIRWTRFVGASLPPNTSLITRSTRYGNPFPVCEHRSQQQAVDQFGAFLATRVVDPAWLCCDRDILRRAERYPTAQQIRRDLAGRDLACACQPGTPCHGDPLLALANGPPTVTASRPARPLIDLDLGHAHQYGYRQPRYIPTDDGEALPADQTRTEQEPTWDTDQPTE
ncbi:DUF4326 domain-containing protein [Micromonospora lupini]|uniref:DUF4326 domain-containing protein n=1 Tax=Micromonospora lupini TaxID=285679 RepID=UPI00224F7564|nr:DUF4326 domain-containing protein [Micromonospora lupini]MCX5066605.1 DUF4326 domain-containing protein [Micromonospora lupini]